MFELLVSGGLLAAGYYVVRAFRERRQQEATADAQRQTLARRMALQRAEARQQQAKRARAARDMQTAILQLPEAHDFRRAAAYAAHAAKVGVPLAFRQRQFTRLRRQIVEHVGRRLSDGATKEATSIGLKDLVSGLGIASYEAEYILAEAQRMQTPETDERPDYRTRLRELHREHEERLEAIRQTRNLQDDIREQLLEAEHERFRAQMLEEVDGGTR